MAKRRRHARAPKPTARAPKPTLDTIATFIINLATRGGGVTHGKLQLILFYVQAVSLAQQGRPMFDEDFVADAQGPLLPSVQARYAHHGTGPIASPGPTAAMPNQTRKALGPILASFGAQTESTLREIACSAGPWLEARSRITINDQQPTIDKQTMTTFYRQRNADAAATRPPDHYSQRL